MVFIPVHIVDIQNTIPGSLKLQINILIKISDFTKCITAFSRCLFITPHLFDVYKVCNKLHILQIIYSHSSQIDIRTICMSVLDKSLRLKKYIYIYIFKSI